jgi:hypothetical protein
MASPSPIPIATLFITPAAVVTPTPANSALASWTFVPGAEPTQVFFYSSKLDLLRISVSGSPPTPIVVLQSAAAWTVPAGLPTPLASWFQFSGNEIKWGTTMNDGNSTATGRFTALALEGGASSTAQTSTTATAIQGSSVALSTSSSLPNNSTSTTGSPTQASGTAGSNKGGLSGGAAAGVAIGCLIAGALIAGLIFWFCWGKRKPSRARDYEASRTALMPHEKGFATNAVPLGSGSPAAAPVAGALPLPLEDKAVTGEISKISNSIKNHVQSYYQMGRVSPGLIDLDDIHALGNSQPISAGTLSTLLDSAATREIALRFCIAWIVCSRMQPGADPKTSLLPVELAGCMGKMTNERRGSPGKDDNVCDLCAN